MKKKNKKQNVKLPMNLSRFSLIVGVLAFAVIGGGTYSLLTNNNNSLNTSFAASGGYPKVASPQQESGESWADSCQRNLSYGFNGCVMYLPSGKLPSWNSNLQTLANRIGDQTFYLQLTAKTHDDNGLANVLQNLPDAWKEGFIYNIYQEPEDNLLTASEQAAYRQAYTDAAKVTRQYGANLPWVEWQEWTVDPNNNKGWDLANFTPPAEDFGGVLWSFFEYGERDRIDHQINLVLGAMETYAPGKPWGLMASAYTLENAPYSEQQKLDQAKWLTDSYNKTKAAGSQGWAWFNFYWAGTGGASGEARVEANPYTLDAMNNLDDSAPTPDPDPEPEPDTEFPIGEITNPAPNSTLNGNQIIQVSATDNVGVVKVNFLIDGVFQKSITSAPYEWTWDTTSYSDGQHEILVKIYDAVNNKTEKRINVYTQNSTISTTPGDLNSDSKVDITDLSILLSDWGNSGVPSDINNDGIVDISDLSILLSNWT